MTTGKDDIMAEELFDGVPICDVCNVADYEADGWCGNCGCCTTHCQGFDGCAWVIVASDETDAKGRPLYWSNDEGWVQRWDATVFDYNEQMSVSLPLGGEWEEA